jgi:hypothetical protein
VVQPLSVVGQWHWISSYPGGNPASYPHYPLTPQNTGTTETLEFNSNSEFSQTVNDTLAGSGTYKTGHGVYTPYSGSYQYIFDSIAYFVNGAKRNVDYYHIQHTDTLVFSSSFAGLIGGGSKYYLKQ